MYNTLALVNKSDTMDLGAYITGFTDGEGCFTVSFSKRSKLKLGIEARPSFSIAQNARNIAILQEIKLYFGVGSIRYGQTDNTYKFDVRSIHDLTEVIIPHFKKYPLLTTKLYDFKSFEKICEIIKAGGHLQADKMEQIIDLAYTMNVAGNRKKSKEELLRCMTR